MQKNPKLLFAKVLLVGSFTLAGLGLSCQTALAQSGETSRRQSQVQKELGTFAQLAKELNPSVVGISVQKQSRVSSSMRIPDEFRNLIPEELLPERPEARQPDYSGQGSGVIISSNGEILTNNHVVANASAIKVKLFDGRELEAEVLGSDANTDLALLKVKDASQLPVAQLGDSDALQVGEWVMAIGNPFGLEATVTVGVLSGKGRVIGAGPYDDYLQTDTSINPGNSGGPLFDIAGRVVGINTAIFRGGQGIGFSIPINLAKEIAAQLREHGEVRRGFIGVGTQPLTTSLKSALGLPAEVSGALVSSVIPEGPAARAGLEVSDLLLEVDGKKVGSDRDLLREVAKLRAGSQVPVKVLREGKILSYTLRIAERPSDTVSREVPVVRPDEPGPACNSVGLTVVDPREGGGPMVQEVVPNSRAAKAGLRPGDHIRAVGTRKINSAKEFNEALSRSNKEQLALLIERRGRTSYVVLQ